MALLVTGCVTPRLYSPLELADVAIGCDVPTTDLAQDPDLKRVLFFYTVAPSTDQLDCVHKWARKHRLHLAYIEAVEQHPEQVEP